MSEQINRTLGAGDAVNFVMIGDYGQTTPEQTLPVDVLAAMIDGWSPDFIMALGDNNYIAGYADTIDVNVGKNFAKYIYPKGTYTPSTMPGCGRLSGREWAKSILPHTRQSRLQRPYR
jgi:hypothetical protein